MVPVDKNENKTSSYHIECPWNRISFKQFKFVLIGLRQTSFFSFSICKVVILNNIDISFVKQSFPIRGIYDIKMSLFPALVRPFPLSQKLMCFSYIWWLKLKITFHLLLEWMNSFTHKAPIGLVPLPKLKYFNCCSSIKYIEWKGKLFYYQVYSRWWNQDLTLNWAMSDRNGSSYHYINSIIKLYTIPSERRTIRTDSAATKFWWNK